MQKRDVYNHEKNFDSWLDGLTDKYIEESLTKENSDLFIKYFKWLSERKTKGYINRNRSKLKSIFKGMQSKGIQDISKAKIKQIEDYFFEWKKAGHSIDYAKRWNAFWSWWSQINRREGKMILDLKVSLKDLQEKGDGESTFVWLTKEEFDQLRKFFDEDKQTILLFAFDTLIRFPTEILSLKTSNIYKKGDEVWVEIPTEISKTIGRKFNLVYSGEAILEYIRRNKKESDDYLFEFNPYTFNNELQRISKQVFGNKKSEGGEFYKNLTGYDLRHSGAIHFRQLFQKTGQSLDLLRERGGWSDFKMINYYTKRLGLDGHIQKEKLLLEEDKTKIEKDVERLKKQNSYISEIVKLLIDNQNKTLSPKEVSKRVNLLVESVSPEIKNIKLLNKKEGLNKF
jgi:integrase